MATDTPVAHIPAAQTLSYDAALDALDQLVSSVQAEEDRQACAIVRGCAHTGKTTLARALVQRLVAGVPGHAGASAESILVICATETAAADMRYALAEEAGEAGVGDAGAVGSLGRVQITTARQFELDVLDRPDARNFTGRAARILTRFEEAFFFEDMRVTGIPQRRLRGMLGFFRKSLTELADDDMQSFIIDQRERVALETMQRVLRAYGAYLDCEVAHDCVHYLRHCADAGNSVAGSVTHIIVDDYQCLNKASQLVLELMRPHVLVALADPVHAAAGSDPFPYIAGVDGFAELHPGALEIALKVQAGLSGAAAAAPALVLTGYLDAMSPFVWENRGREQAAPPYDVTPCEPALDDIELTIFETPAAECDAVAARVGQLLLTGAGSDDILVSAPHHSWLMQVGRALDRMKIPSQTLSARQGIGGSFRDLAGCAEGRMFAALGLLADPDDGLSWRVWCGCGDHLAHSPSFMTLMEEVEKRGVTLAEALQQAVGEGAGSADTGLATPDGRDVARAWEQSQAMLVELSGLRGAELLEALAAGLGLPTIPAWFMALPIGPADTAQQIFTTAYQQLVFPELSPGKGVRLVTADAVCALQAKHVIVCGMMNGWIPPHAYSDAAEATYGMRQRMDKTARHAVYHLAACAAGTLTVTGFAQCDLELAERKHLKGHRVFAGKDNRRMTTTSVSDLARWAMHAWGLSDFPADLVELPGIADPEAAIAEATRQARAEGGRK